MKGCASVLKRLLLIINPTSGRGMIKDYLLLIIKELSLAGYEVVVYPTKSKNDATNKMKEAKSYDLIVASGGDGTLNEVITGLIKANANTPIAYIPTGTTNDFATTLGIPKNIRELLNYVQRVKLPLLISGSLMKDTLHTSQHLERLPMLLMKLHNLVKIC